MRFNDLKEKEVINSQDCRRLGFIVDAEIDVCTGKFEKIIIPVPGKFCKCIGKNSEYSIDFDKIKKVGSDIIIIDVDLEKKDKKES